jgi:hypothetical protein
MTLSSRAKRGIAVVPKEGPSTGTSAILRLTAQDDNQPDGSG